MDDHIKFHAQRLRKKEGMKRASLLEGVVEEEESATTTAGKPITCKAMVARAPRIHWYVKRLQ